MVVMALSRLSSYFVTKKAKKAKLSLLKCKVMKRTHNEKRLQIGKKKNCNQNDLVYFVTEFFSHRNEIFFSSKRSIFYSWVYIFFIPYPLRRANIQYTYLLLSDLSHQLLLRTSHTKQYHEYRLDLLSRYVSLSLTKNFDLNFFDNILRKSETRAALLLYTNVVFQAMYIVCIWTCYKNMFFAGMGNFHFLFRRFID